MVPAFGPREAKYVETLGEVRNVFIRNLEGLPVAVLSLVLALDLVPDLDPVLALDLDPEDPGDLADREDPVDREGEGREEEDPEDVDLGRTDIS